MVKRTLFESNFRLGRIPTAIAQLKVLSSNITCLAHVVPPTPGVGQVDSDLSLSHGGVGRSTVWIHQNFVLPLCNIMLTFPPSPTISGYSKILGNFPMTAPYPHHTALLPAPPNLHIDFLRIERVGGKRWIWSHLHFLRYWMGGFYMVVGLFSFRPCVKILFSLVTISIFIFTRGMSGAPPSTPSPPEINSPDFLRWHPHP